MILIAIEAMVQHILPDVFPLRLVKLKCKCQNYLESLAVEIKLAPSTSAHILCKWS